MFKYSPDENLGLIRQPKRHIYGKTEGLFKQKAIDFWLFSLGIIIS